MKLKTILTLCVVAFCSMACDKKNNDPQPIDFAGNYTGYTLASCSYFQNMVSADESVVITKNADGSASVSFTSETWGKFTISNAQVSMSDKLCTLTGSGQTQMGMSGQTASYDCSFSAEIKSQTEAHMKFTIPTVMGGMTLEFKTGTAPTDLLLAGTYEGYTKADCSYFQNRYTDDESVTLSANGDGTVKVVFESASWGTFTVSSATVTKENDTYTFSGNGNVAMGMGSSTSDYAFTLNGQTNAAKDNFSIHFQIPAVMGGLEITLLPGTAPAVTE